MPRWLYAFLIFAVMAPLLTILHIPVPPLLLFLIAGLGILPLAALIGQSVEQIAEHTGERIGGLLFATFGNATELIIGIFALSQGLVGVVRAAIIGSILGNVLLVLGVSVCIGGFKHGQLRFEIRPANLYGSLLALCIGGLVLPTFAELLASHNHQTQITEHGILLSDFIAVLLLLGYFASILFSVFRLGDTGAEDEPDPILGARSAAAIARLLAYRHQLAQSSQRGKTGVLRQIDSTLEAIVSQESGKTASVGQEAAEAEAARNLAQTQPQTQTQTPGSSTGHQQEAQTQKDEGDLLRDGLLKHLKDGEQPSENRARSDSFTPKKPALWTALALLAGTTAGVAWLSDILVGQLEPFTTALHWNPAFVGLIFVPLIGGLPEYFNTISMALDKRMGMVLAASAGSSIQIALLIAPILVLVSLFMPQRLDLVFSIVELAVLGLATFLFSEITKDGELVWLEGLLLILLYTMMGGTVFIFGS